MPCRHPLTTGSAAVDHACGAELQAAGGDDVTSDGHLLMEDPWGTLLTAADSGDEVRHATPDLRQTAPARQVIPSGHQRRTDLDRLNPG